MFWEQGKEKEKQCLDHFVLILGTVKISFHGAFATLSFFSGENSENEIKSGGEVNEENGNCS